MTTIAIHQNDESIIVSADTQGLLGGHRVVGLQKVYQIDDMLFACSGTVAFLNILFDYVKPLRDRLEEFPVQFSFTDFSLGLREKLNGHNFMSSESNNYGLESVIVVNGVAYYIDGQLGISEISEDFYSLGTGADYAHGAYHALRNLSPEIGLFTSNIDRHGSMRKIMQAVGAYDSNTGSEIEIFEVPRKAG